MYLQIAVFRYGGKSSRSLFQFVNEEYFLLLRDWFCSRLITFFAFDCILCQDVDQK